MNNVTIRNATREDIPACADLLFQLFSIEVDFRPDRRRQQEGLTMLLQSSGGKNKFLVAELRSDSGSAVVGMVTGQLNVSTAEGAYSVLVEDMVVDSGFRGQGIGTLLLEAIGRWAVSMGATRLQLLADRDNTSALRFYGDKGWHLTQMVCLRTHPAEVFTGKG